MAPKFTPKKSPVSAFNGGKYKNSPPGLSGAKDKCNKLIVEGLQQGVVVVHVKKHNKEEEAFIGYDIHFLEENMDVMEELGINAIVMRKGIDGETPLVQSPGSSYHWKQFLLIVGEAANTKEGRAQLALKLVKHFNTNAATAEMYQYPTKMRFFKDITFNKPRPVDSCLLDADVVGLMGAAFPSLELEELVTYTDIMQGFWTNIEHGKEVMENGPNAEE